jgi:hypothetical protein
MFTTYILLLYSFNLSFSQVVRTVQPIPDKKIIQGIIDEVAQGIKQENTNSIVCFFSDKHTDLESHLDTFFSKTRSRKNRPEWKDNAPRQDLKSHWDFTINTISLEKIDSTFIANLEFYWLVNAPLAQDVVNQNSPTLIIKDKWIFHKVSRDWKITEAENFLHFVKKYQ